MPLLLPDQRTDRWLNARKGRITSSVAAACLGLHPWISRQKAWRIIKGTEPERRNPHMDRGVEREDEARSCYEDETGNLVLETGLWVHPEHDWLAASPDGIIGDLGLVEIKCPLVLPDALPIYYGVQMAVAMAVTGRVWCDFFAFIERHWCWRRRIFRNEEREQKLIADLHKYYVEFVQGNKQPPRKKRARASDGPVVAVK